MRLPLFAIIVATTIAGVTTIEAQAQSPGQTKEQARAARKAQGEEATKAFTPGEGNPKPEPRARATASERAKARATRQTNGSTASAEFKPGEGDPKPAAVKVLPAQERRAERAKARDEVKQANKARRLPSYGDNYGGK